jgi:hypothetical protein
MFNAISGGKSDGGRQQLATSLKLPQRTTSSVSVTAAGTGFTNRTFGISLPGMVSVDFLLIKPKEYDANFNFL